MTWLASLKAKLIAFGIVAGAVIVVAWRIFAAGKNAAQTEHLKDRLEAVRKKRKAEDQVNALDDDAVDRELRKWMRDR